MEYIKVKKSKIPYFLRKSQLYLNLGDDDEDEDEDEKIIIEKSKYKKTINISSLEDFIRMFETINYFDTIYPNTFFNYFIDNSKKIFKHYFADRNDDRVKDMFLQLIDLDIENENQFITTFKLIIIYDINPIKISDSYIEYGLDNRRNFLKKYPYDPENYNIKYSKLKLKEKINIKYLSRELYLTNDLSIEINSEIELFKNKKDSVESINEYIIIGNDNNGQINNSLFIKEISFNNSSVINFKNMYKFRVDFLANNDVTETDDILQSKVKDYFLFIKNKERKSIKLYEYGVSGNKSFESFYPEFMLLITQFNNKTFHKIFSDSYDKFLKKIGE